MQPEIGACRLAPRKVAREQEEVQCSVEQAACSSLGKDRHFLLSCGPGGGGNGTELAIAETKIRDAYSGRVAQNVGREIDKTVGKRKDKWWRAQGQRAGFINTGPTRPTILMRMGWTRETAYDERHAKHSRLPQESHEDERARMKRGDERKGVLNPHTKRTANNESELTCHQPSL